MSLRAALLILLNVSTPALAVAPGRLPLPAVIDRMQKRYDSVSDYRATFAQESTSAALGRTKKSAGVLSFKKPGRMRFDYQTPTPMMYLATDQTFWLYQPEDKQAFKQDLKSAQLPAALAFLMGKGKLRDEFDVELDPKLPYGTEADYRLTLHPKKGQGAYRSIHFVIDPQTFLVRESVLVNSQGDINRFLFSEVSLNSKLPDSAFQWSPPPGVKIREVGKGKE